MRKINNMDIRFLFSITICFIVISSCASNLKQMYSGERLPSSESARLHRYPSDQPYKNVKIIIIAFDGKKFSGTPKMIEFLPGSHTISFDFEVDGINRRPYNPPRLIHFTAEAGGEYAFGYPSSERRGFWIYDINTGETDSY